MASGPSRVALPRVLVLLLVPLPALAAVTHVYSINASCPYTALDFFDVPFFVPAGTAEVEVYHHLMDPASTTNILDWGLSDATGRLMGWGGGNTENAVVGSLASSRSYEIYYGAPLPTGNWSVVVGKPRIATPPGHFSIVVMLRDAPTLAPQPERRPYAPAGAPLLPAPGALTWYSGDFHVHSRESGDALTSATVDEIATYSRDVAGLDFVHLSDHNTVSAATFFADAQTRHPNLLVLPGVEFTTYSGHAGALFTSATVDHRIMNPNVSIQSAVDAIHAQGGLFSINHMDNYEPDANGDLRNSCVGCAWDYGGSLNGKDLDAMEVAIQAWDGTGWLYTPRALEYWDRLHFLGFTNVAPIGGSDDHHGGQGNSWPSSSIGMPTTCVLAANLSHGAIHEGVRLGRVVLKFDNASDPFLDLTATVDGGSEAVRIGGTVSGGSAARNVTLAATVTPSTHGVARRTLRGAPQLGPASLLLALVRNNEQTFTIDVPGGGSVPFAFNVSVPFPQGGVDRWRAELHDTGTNQIVALTNHIFLPSFA